MSRPSAFTLKVRYWAVPTVLDSRGPSEAPPYDRRMTEQADESFDTESRRYGSLEQALRDKQVPLGNHTLIRRFTSAIGIEGYYERAGYIKGVRTDGGPALNIHFGWTNGFASEKEVLRAAGPEPQRWQSQRGTGQWGVTHPAHGPGGGGGPGGNPVAPPDVCPRCNMELLPGGRCGSCDD